MRVLLLIFSIWASFVAGQQAIGGIQEFISWSDYKFLENCYGTEVMSSLDAEIAQYATMCAKMPTPISMNGRDFFNANVTEMVRGLFDVAEANGDGDILYQVPEGIRKVLDDRMVQASTPEMMTLFKSDLGGDYPVYGDSQVPLPPQPWPPQQWPEPRKDVNLDVSMSLPSNTALQALLMLNEAMKNRKWMDTVPGSRSYNDGYRYPDNAGPKELDGLIDSVVRMAMAKGRYKRTSDPEGDWGRHILEAPIIKKLEKMQMALKSSIGNKTCILEMMQVIDAEGWLIPDAMAEKIQYYGIKDQWLVDRTSMMIRSCNISSRAIPDDFLGFRQLDGMCPRTMAFYNCVHSEVMNVCKKLDVKRQLEQAFGPISELVEKSGTGESVLLAMARHIFSVGGNIFAFRENVET